MLVGVIGFNPRNSGGAQKELIWLSLEIEQSKLNRERSLLMLDKSLLMYFALLIVGIIGFINEYITVKYLNIVVILSFCVLVAGLIPYMVTMFKEESRLSALLSAYHHKDKKLIQKASRGAQSRRKARRPR